MFLFKYLQVSLKQKLWADFSGIQTRIVEVDGAHAYR